jgi:hypothetical protein
MPFGAEPEGSKRKRMCSLRSRLLQQIRASVLKEELAELGHVPVAVGFFRPGKGRADRGDSASPALIAARPTFSAMPTIVMTIALRE